jgi:cbb3-type cytochrome oxidase subunit 3
MTEFVYIALCFFVATSVFTGLSYCILYPIFNGIQKKETKNERTNNR